MDGCKGGGSGPQPRVLDVASWIWRWEKGVTERSTGAGVVLDWDLCGSCARGVGDISSTKSEHG